jgi:hypothetical protein
MKQLARAAHWVAHNAWMELLIGLLVGGTGAWELYHQALEGILQFKGEHAVALIGLCHVVVALEGLLLGLEHTTRSASEVLSEEQGWTCRHVGRVIHGPVFQFLLGALLVLAGVIEAVEEWTLAQEHRQEVAWFLGLVVLGSSGLAKAAAGCIKGVHCFLQAHRQWQWRSNFFPRLHQWVHSAHLGAVVAIILVATGVAEEVWRYHADRSTTVAAHHGLVLLGLFSLLRELPVIFHGAWLMDDASRRRCSSDRRRAPGCTARRLGGGEGGDFVVVMTGKYAGNLDW